MARPNLGGGRAAINRPNIGASRPNIGANRPNIGGGGMARPGGNGNLGGLMGQRPGNPSIGANRPNIGANRPNLGGNIGANRPNLGANRPGLGGNLGANRPGLGGNAGLTRPGIGGTMPSTRPGLADRPGLGGGNRPGLGGDRPGLGGGNRPGLGTLPNRPGLGGGDRPGLGGDRPGLGGGNRPGLGGGDRPGLGTLPNRPGLGGGDRPGIGGGNRPGLGGGDRPGGGLFPNRPGGGGDRPGGGGNWAGGGGLFPNRPGGGGDRPGGGLFPNRPGGGGDRPGGGGNWAGGGNRPNWPGIIDRPGRPGNRPNWPDNRPGGGGNWAGGGNRPNWPGNRPGGGNNWNNNNNRWNNWTNNNVTNNNININNWGLGGGGWGGGWGGGGWGGGGWGGWGGGAWGFPASPWGWGGGWAHGSWNNWNSWNFGNSFLFGLGTSLGMGAGNWLMGGYVAPVNTWGAWGLNSWGLGPVATQYVQTTYVNPFYDPAAFAQPTTVVINNTPTTVQPPAFDYSQPINPTTASNVQPDDAQVALNTFDGARNAFKLGSYEEALQLTNQAIKQLGSDASVHEFRALTLFALARYEEAAATLYPVLSAGPGWDWTTMIGLYSSADVYTQQQRALETYCNANPDAAGARFLLGYHYLVQGHKDAAALMFQKVAQLRPTDTLSAQLSKALNPPPDGQQTPSQIAEAKATADSGDSAPAETSKPDPRLVGAWSASVPDNTTIRLTITTDGNFTWAVTQKDQEQSIQGKSGVDPDGVLALIQDDGPPLTGRIEVAPDGQSFTFQPLSGPNAPRITFRKAA
jgi:hypothetical protein